ncbi:MAG: hypothetical protein ACAH82_04475 [Solirubrobacteraceae bacterium]
MELHRFAGDPQGEPLAAGAAGARIRIALDSPPSPRWSRAFAAHLATELVGSPGVSRLRLDHAVQGADVVLEGIEEVCDLGPALRSSIDAANHVCDRPAPEHGRSRNMDQATADGVARAIADDLSRCAPPPATAPR